MRHKCILKSWILLFALLVSNSHSYADFFGGLLDFTAEIAENLNQGADIPPWQLRRGENNFVFVGSDVLTPIQTNPAEIILESDLAFLRFSENNMSGVVGVPVTDTVIQANTSYQSRPTLFVSIHGAQTGVLEDGHSPTDNWQNALTTRLVRHMGGNQFKHFMVNWHSLQQKRGQVKDVASMINRFLTSRAYDWDVVIIGHSRGGIFAHDLTKHLLNNNKINTMQTVLLDPTAIPAVGDVYPHSEYNSSKFDIQSYVYFDGECFEENLSICAFTDADRKIHEYTNYTFNSKHEDFPWDWMNREFDTFVDDLLASKMQGNYLHDFSKDGITKPEETRSDDLDQLLVVHMDDIYIDGNITIGDDFVEVYGELGVGPFVSAGGSLYAGKNGIEASANVMFVAASTAINKDYIGASADTGIAGISASLSDEGIQYNWNIDYVASTNLDVSGGEINFDQELLGVSTGASFSDSGSNVNLSIGGTTIISISL